MPSLKHILFALAVVSMSLSAACKKTDSTDTGAAAGGSTPAATDNAMGASGAAAASGASE